MCIHFGFLECFTTPVTAKDYHVSVSERDRFEWKVLCLVSLDLSIAGEVCAACEDRWLVLQVECLVSLVTKGCVMKGR